MTQTLANRLTEFAQLDPDGLALEGLTTRYTWRELWWAVNELTIALNNFKNKVLAIYSNNSPEWIIADLAASMSGVILLPLPTFFSSFQCAYVLKQASADAVLCAEQPGWLTELPTQVDNGRPIEVGDQHWQLISLESNHDALIPPDCSKITFTSGSTGHPKGVCLTNDHQERVAKAIVETTQLRPGTHLT